MSNPTRLIIQNGRFANDGEGDTLRDAATKINDNFENLWGVLEIESLNFSNVPTSDPSVEGLLWRDSDNGNVLKVSRG